MGDIYFGQAASAMLVDPVARLAVDGAELSLKRRGAEILQETGEGLKATVDAGKQAYSAAIKSEPTA